MTPDQAKAIALSVGQQLQEEWMTTYKVIKAVPEEKKDYKPEGNSRSAGELAQHLATADFMFLDGIIAGEFATWKEDRSPKTIEQLAESYRQEFPKRLERILALDGANLAKDVAFGPVAYPAVKYLVWTLAHMVHHRGQLSTYLRPMGSKVPSIYGGSFDEPWQG